MFNMQNQQRTILTIIDVRGRKFDIPVERITESYNAFLGKVRVIQEESTLHNPVCRLPDNHEGVEAMAHVLLYGTFAIPPSIAAEGRQLEYLVHVAGVGETYDVACMAELACNLFASQLNCCTSPYRFIAAVRTIYTYPRSHDKISAMKRDVVYFVEAHSSNVTWIRPACDQLFAEVDGFEADYREARRQAGIA